MRNSFAKHLLALAHEDESILLITGDLGYGVLDEFQKQLPGQYINSGVAEQSMMSMAAGLASRGYRPFVYSIANFPTFRCLEQIRNDVCYMQNPVTVVAVGAGLGYGVHGYTHHAVEDIAVMRAMPNMQIYSPADSLETNHCVDLILADRSPAYLRLGKGGEPLINSKPIEPQARNIIIDQGPDGVICWTGGIGAKAINAAAILSEIGIKPTLISVPVLSERSISHLLATADGRAILSLEEHTLSGGFGSWILEVASDEGYVGTINRVGVTRETNTQIGSQNYLLEYSGLSPEAISSRFQELLN